jgi:hypothetical protein
VGALGEPRHRPPPFCLTTGSLRTCAEDAGTAPAVHDGASAVPGGGPFPLEAGASFPPVPPVNHLTARSVALYLARFGRALPYGCLYAPEAIAPEFLRLSVPRKGTPPPAL